MPPLNTLPGNQLTLADQSEVLRSYVHRFTKQHKPDWARLPWKDGKPYPVQFASDADWLANTQFGVTKDGRLDRRVRECISSPTWPDNPELQVRAAALAP